MSAPNFLELLLFNAAAATVLALLAAAVGRLTRRPGLAHALWALVLVKLLFPPVVEMAVVPRAALTPPPAIVTAPSAAAPTSAVVASAPNASAVAPASDRVPPGGATAVLLVWAAGSLFLLGLTLVRTRRFRRLVATACDPPNELARSARLLAYRMGVRCPELKIVAARVSPMLWFPGRRPTLLFPAALLGSLDAAEREALLAHELAHVRRRDHLLRFVELLATIAFWWHPVVWWARRMLRQLEEQSCDAEVLHALPGRGGAYARGLVKTVEFLAGGASRMPALASGAAREGAARNLEERLKMILNDTTPRLLSRTQRLLLATVAIAALLIVPSWAEPRDDEKSHPQRDDAVAEEYNQRLRDIEREALQLELSMQDLDARRRRIELERVQLERERDAAILRSRAVEAERDGRREEAELMRRKADHVEQIALAEAERHMLEAEYAQRARDLEIELWQQRLESGEATGAGDRARAEDLKRKLYELEREQAQMMAEQATLDEYAAQHEKKAAAEVHRALEFELQQREAQEQAVRRELLMGKLKAIQDKARQLEADGRHEEAEELRHELRLLKEKLDAEPGVF